MYKNWSRVYCTSNNKMINKCNTHYLICKRLRQIKTIRKRGRHIHIVVAFEYIFAVKIRIILLLYIHIN